jgi:hypothetical protein
MRARLAAGLAALLLAAATAASAAPAGSFAGGRLSAAAATAPAAGIEAGSAFAVASVLPSAARAEGPVLAARARGERGDAAPRDPHAVLTAERARVLLRSLTVPGWGQATIGRRGSSLAFLIAEAGVWTSFTAFRVQEQMRREAYERTARVLGGIDLNGRDEEFRRIVGSYISSEEYNLLVVARDAANLYYDQPDSMRWYIKQNELRGGDTWAWADEGALLRYRGQRKDAQRARLRTSTALGLAVVNRVLSVIHAARASGGASGAEPRRSFRFEAAPPPGGDPTAIRVGVRADF